MQNSSENDNPPSFKYHNLWAYLVALLLTLIPISLQVYSDSYGVDAVQRARIVEAQNLMDQLKVKIKSVDEQGVLCNSDIQAINRILGTTNVLGASTGSAIRKVDPEAPSVTPSTVRPTPDEIILFVPTGTATVTPRPTPTR